MVWTSNSGDMINFVGTLLVKNHVNKFPWKPCIFHSALGFVLGGGGGKNSLHLNLCILVKQSSNNIFLVILGSDIDKQMKRFINITESIYFGGHFENMQIRT